MGRTDRCQLDSSLGKLLRGRLGWVSGDAPNAEVFGKGVIGQDVVDDRSTLVSGCSKDGDDPGHGRAGCG